jgi:hypothetical protein
MSSTPAKVTTSPQSNRSSYFGVCYHKALEPPPDPQPEPQETSDSADNYSPCLTVYSSKAEDIARDARTI